jgi:hypothetical protein
MRPYLKYKLKAKELGLWPKVVEHLSSKHEALSSIPSTTEIRTNKLKY